MTGHGLNISTERYDRIRYDRRD